MKKEVKQTGEKNTALFKKVGGFFSRIGTYFKEVFAETTKLSWPGKKELVGYTVAVIGFVAVRAALMWVLDLGFSKGIGALAKIVVK